MANSTLDTPIEFLKGIGPQRADTLKKELSIFTQGDLLIHFPFRYIDKTSFFSIKNIAPDSGEVLLRGTLRRLETLGEGKAKRMVGSLRDETGVLDLVWFRSLAWLEKSLAVGKEYIVFGRVADFNGKFNIPHPEMEEITEENSARPRHFDPVYPTTEKFPRQAEY